MSGSAGAAPFSVELSEWENINGLLKRHGCSAVRVAPGPDMSGGVVLDPQASLALRAAITSLVEDTERRQNLIHGLIQSNNQLKDDVRMQQDRAGRQEQRAEDLQRVLDGVKAKIRELEDDFLRKKRQQRGEVTALRQEKEAAQEKLREQEQSIAQLRRRLAQAAAAMEERMENGRRSSQRVVKRQEDNHLDQQKRELPEGPVLERSHSVGSLDLDTTPNYKALVKSYQEQIQEARRKEEQLLREKERLREELEGRPSVREFRVYKQQMRKMEKLLLQNNLRCRSATREDQAEPERATVAGLELLPDGECHRHLQDVCRELGVQDVKDLLPVAASKFRKAKTCSTLYKVLSDISAVLCGPRAPPLLYKPCTRGPDGADEADFVHLLPTIELWGGQLLSLQTLRRSLMRLRRALDAPADRAGEAPEGVRVEDLLLLVDTMVEEVESRRQGPSPPPHLLQALVSHFQRLFDVPSVSGVLPRMNEVYSKVGEMSNVLRTLRSLLGLDDAAAAATVVNAVGRRHRLQQLLGTLDLDSIVNKIQEHEEFFPAFEELIEALLDVLEIVRLEEILPEVQRLKRLDGR